MVFLFHLQDYYLLRSGFPEMFGYNSRQYNVLSATPETSFRFGLFRFRSPLLTESIFLSLPLGT